MAGNAGSSKYDAPAVGGYVMRVFLAIDISEEVRGRLAAMTEELRPTSTAARWVASESVHLTLKFIGEIPRERCQDIDRGLVGLSWKPFPISVHGIGFFPGARSARVLWAGLHAPALQGLAEEIEVRLEREGFERDERKFSPHLTLARSKNVKLESSLVNACERFLDADFGSFTVDRYYLYESTLKPGGSTYTKLKEYLL